MLAWVVTFRSTLRRTRKSRSFCVLHRSPRVAFAFSGRIPLTFSAKSFRLNLFADPHPLTLVAPIFYKNIRGRGTKFPNSFAAHAREISRCLDLSPLEYPVADKHSVLPTFTRNRPYSSPLEATLLSRLVSVDSKWFTVKPKS